MKNTNTDPNTSNVNILTNNNSNNNKDNHNNFNNTSGNKYEIKDPSNNSNCNSANLNLYVNSSLAASNQYLQSLPNNPSGNYFKSSSTTINHELNNNLIVSSINNKINKTVIKPNINKFKNSAISIKPVNTGIKLNKNNSCNIGASAIQNSANSNINSQHYYKSHFANNKASTKQPKVKKLLNFSNNSLNNTNNTNTNINNNSTTNNNMSSKTNAFAGSRKLLASSNNTSLLKQDSNNLNYLTSNISNLNNNNNNLTNNNSGNLIFLQNKNASDSSSILSNSKNKTASNFLEESKLQTQSNVSYSFKSTEVVKIKPIKPAKLDAGERGLDRKIDEILFDNIGKIKTQLDCMDDFLKEFEKETEFVKKNL